MPGLPALHAGFLVLRPRAGARAKKAGLWAQPVSDWVYPPEWRFLKNGEIRVVPTPYEETLEKCLATYQRAGKGTYVYEPPK